MAPRHHATYGDKLPHAAQAEHCTMVIFGATGDLTKRKLFPALYQLAEEHLLGPGVRGARRRTRDVDRRRVVPRAHARGARRVGRGEARRRGGLGSRSRSGSSSSAATRPTRRRTRGSSAKLDEIESECAPAERNRFFYLAVPPSVFEPIVRLLVVERARAAASTTRQQRPWARVVVEKPFGRSLETAHALNALVLVAVRRAPGVPHRSLPREGDGAERPRAALRQLDLRAAVEPAVGVARADHRGGDGGRGGARQVLRGSGRRARHVPEPPAAAARAHGDGAAVGDDGGRGARREGEGAAVHPVADAGVDPRRTPCARSTPRGR